MRRKPRWLWTPDINGEIVQHAFRWERDDQFSSLCGQYERRKGAILDDSRRCLACMEALKDADY